MCVSYSIYGLQRLATPQWSPRPIDLNILQGLWGTLSQNSHQAKLHSFGPVSCTSGQRDRKHVHNNGLPDRPTGSHCRRVTRLHDHKDGAQVTKHTEHCKAKCIKDSSMIRAQSSDFLSISISHCISETVWNFRRYSTLGSEHWIYYPWQLHAYNDQDIKQASTAQMEKFLCDTELQFGACKTHSHAPPSLPFQSPCLQSVSMYVMSAYSYDRHELMPNAHVFLKIGIIHNCVCSSSLLFHVL